MKDKIALLLKEAHDNYPPYNSKHWWDYADKILALFKDVELKWYNGGWHYAIKPKREQLKVKK